MSWPPVSVGDWRIVQMHRASRSYHVRKHFLRLAERWHQLSSMSRGEISVAATTMRASGCPTGYDAKPDDAPRSAGHATAYDLYARDYMPYVRVALQDAVEGRTPLVTFPPTPSYEPRSIIAITNENVVIVCSGREALTWRTAYRAPSGHRPGLSPEKIQRDHVRSLTRSASYWHDSGRGPKSP